MTKYWLIAVLSLFIIGACSVAIRTSLVHANESVVTASDFDGSKPTINPSEYIRRLTQTPPRRPLSNNIPFEREPLASPSGMNKQNSEAFALKRDKLKMKLADDKLKKCETVSKNISERTKKMMEKITEMEKKLTSIVNGVKEYYVKKNLNLSNYSTLVTAIDVKAAALEPLIATTTSDIAAFSCTGEGPHERLKLVDADVRAVLTALKEYRTETHTLIKAIKELPVATVTPVPTSTQ